MVYSGTPKSGNRDRSISQDSENCGTPCTDALEEAESCNTHDCGIGAFNAPLITPFNSSLNTFFNTPFRHPSLRHLGVPYYDDI